MPAAALLEVLGDVAPGVGAIVGASRARRPGRRRRCRHRGCRPRPRRAACARPRFAVQGVGAAGPVEDVVAGIAVDDVGVHAGAVDVAVAGEDKILEHGAEFVVEPQALTRSRTAATVFFAS